MRPSQQFINMIAVQFQHRQKSISNNDLIKHNNQPVSFYSISYGKFRSITLLTKTEAFSDQILIEMDKGGKTVTIGTDLSHKVYKQVSPIQFIIQNGKGLIHWQIADASNEVYTIVKMMADDGTVQIQLISPDGINHTIHNVCELHD